MICRLTIVTIDAAGNVILINRNVLDYYSAECARNGFIGQSYLRLTEPFGIPREKTVLFRCLQGEVISARVQD